MPSCVARSGSSGSPARNPSGPPSTTNPSTCSVAMIPPARRSLSRMLTSHPPARVSSHAAASPAMPAPATTTFTPPPSSLSCRVTDDVGDCRDQPRAVIERGCALELNADTFGERLILDVDIVEDLDVITDEADRHEQHALTSYPGQVGNDFASIWTQPGVCRGAGALIGDMPIR